MTRNPGLSREDLRQFGRRESRSRDDWLALVDALIESNNQMAAARDELHLRIIAGEDVTVMGVPVRISVEWPNGVPAGFADAAAVRDWARAELAEMRERRAER